MGFNSGLKGLNALVRFAERRNLVSCACAITFQLASTSHAVATETQLSPVAYQIGVTVGGVAIFCLIVYCLLPTNETLDTVHPVSNLLIRQRVQCGVYLHSLRCYAIVMNGRVSQLSARNTFAIELLCIHSFDQPASHQAHEPATQVNEVLPLITCAHSNNYTSTLFGLASFNPLHLLD
jgi:hypothetical protein